MALVTVKGKPSNFRADGHYRGSPMHHDPVPHRHTKFASRTLVVALAFTFLLFAPDRSQGQSLSSRVLVVYNSANSDSTNVANYYIAKRGIPAANLCAITPPSTTYL